MLSFWIVLGLLIPCISGFSQEAVRVSTAEELVLSIASDRTIILEQGEYYLSEAEGVFTEHAAWEEVFDGQQLLIHDVENLTIMSEQGATILSEPRYSYVLSFIDCLEINLDYLAISHTEAGYCSGGVVRLEGCEQVTLQSCGLFGSGTVGVDIYDSYDVRVLDSTIGECTYGAVWIQASARVIFADTEISGNEAFSLIDVDESSEIVFEHCWIGYNYGYAVLRLDEQSYPTVFDNVSLEGNEVDFFAEEDSPLPELLACIFTDNTFTDPSADPMLEEIDDLGYYSEEEPEFTSDYYRDYTMPEEGEWEGEEEEYPGN